jgi:hypothetical protein
LRLADVEDARSRRGASALLFLTDRCPVGCAHCSVDSRPDSPRVRDFRLLRAALAALASHRTIEVVGISGGEPFVERRALPEAVETLSRGGKEVVVYTSGYWAVDPAVPGWFAGVAGDVSCVFLSTDSFHAEQVAPQRFRNALVALRSLGLPVVVQVLDDEPSVTTAVTVVEQALGGDAAAVEINRVPKLPYGRGASQFDRWPQRPAHSFAPCGLVNAPVVRYDGVVSACCNERVILGAGPDRLRRRFADAASLAGALDDLEHDKVLAAIGAVGPGALTSLPELRQLREQPCPSICEACWALLETVDGAGLPRVLQLL